MPELIGFAIAPLLLSAAVFFRFLLRQREQEARAIAATIRGGDCAELSYLLAGTPRFDLVSACCGEPALILAVQSAADSSGGTVELLLRRGADANERGTEWKTALMHAAQLGSADICRLLLDHGADAQARDLWGQTAAGIARESSHESLVPVLERARARMR